MQTIAASIKKDNKRSVVVKAILFCVVFTILFVVFSFAKNFLPSDFERLGYGIIGTAAALVTTVLFLRFDQRHFGDIGLTWERKTIFRFLAGIALGIVIMGSLAASVLYFSKVTIELNRASNAGHFILMTIPLIPLAFMEELGFRSYPLQVLKSKVGIRLAIVITSILFALYHMVNGWSVASSFLGPAIWGLVFGLAAVYSKGIAMPTGLHYAANLTTAAFGATDHPFSLWIVKPLAETTAEAKVIDWANLLPSLVLLVFAVCSLEYYMRQQTNTAIALTEKSR